jgi:transposase-like protein
MTRVNVERWRKHVTAQHASGMTVAQYAQEHGLSRHTLYVARRQVAAARKMPTKGSVSATSAAAKAAPFVAVRVTSSPVTLRASLPNGVALEFAQMEADTCAQLIGMLAALSCSN